ncbi:MAG: hypothetical protein E6J78_06485 [Deltaproteobacteria bacterium]|nr:MAG: hypothetical protein E6J78_06485 [Deltaproteobacteria bacterium]
MSRTALLLLLLAGCSHATIPGTQIPDEPKTRAVLDVFGRYKSALESRDATALYGLASPSYYDPGDPGRGVGPTDYQALQGKLQHDFDKVAGVKLEVTLKDVQVKGEEAHVDYFQVLRYAVNTPSGERWKSESDDARMKMVRVGGEWRISSGL